MVQEFSKRIGLFGSLKPLSEMLPVSQMSRHLIGERADPRLAFSGCKFLLHFAGAFAIASRHTGSPLRRHSFRILSVAQFSFVHDGNQNPDHIQRTGCDSIHILHSWFCGQCQLRLCVSAGDGWQLRGARVWTFLAA